MRSVLIVSVLMMCVRTRCVRIVSIETVSVLIISQLIVSMRRGGVAPGRALAKGKRVRRTRPKILRNFSLKLRPSLCSKTCSATSP